MGTPTPTLNTSSSMSTATTGRTSLNSGSIKNLVPDWKRKHRIQPPHFVRVGGVISPSKFWVSDIPMLRSQKRKASAGSPMAAVMDIERRLGESYNDKAPSLHPEGEVTKIKAGMLVAIRPSHRSSNWFRAKVLNVINKKEVYIKVFLIDYGDVLDDIYTRSCVRKLSKRDAIVKPMAYKVTLAGLRPVTMCLDSKNGMSPALGSKWSNYSKDLVYKIWSKSPAKLARLQNYRRDARSQIHGELCFVGFKRELNINRILINGGHGEYFENLYISDLQAIKTVRQIGPKFTSICGPGQVGGTKIIDESADFSNLDEEELEKYTKIVKKTKPIRRPPPEKDYRPFISKETFDETKARNFKKWEVHRRLSNKPPFLMSTTSTRRTSESSNVSAITGTTELEIQRQVLAGTTQEEPLNIWDNFKLELDSIRAIEGVEKTERKRTQKEKYQKRQIILPAGMDVGRFIEDSLKIMPEPVMGPKQIKPEYLNRAKSPPKAEWEEIPEDSIPD